MRSGELPGREANCCPERSGKRCRRGARRGRAGSTCRAQRRSCPAPRPPSLPPAGGLKGSGGCPGLCGSAELRAARTARRCDPAGTPLSWARLWHQLRAAPPPCGSRSCSSVGTAGSGGAGGAGAEQRPDTLPVCSQAPSCSPARCAAATARVSWPLSLLHIPWGFSPRSISARGYRLGPARPVPAAPPAGMRGEAAGPAPREGCGTAPGHGAGLGTLPDTGESAVVTSVPVEGSAGSKSEWECVCVCYKGTRTALGNLRISGIF